MLSSPDEFSTQLWVKPHHLSVHQKADNTTQTLDISTLGSSTTKSRISCILVMHGRHIQPGMRCQVQVDFEAPKENCSVASIWRMVDADGRFCFPPQFFMQAIVTVVGF